MNLWKILELLPNKLKGVPVIKSYLAPLLRPKGFRWCKLQNDYSILINLEKFSEFPTWLGVFDYKTERFLNKKLSPNSSFIDCGANIGVWSLLACGVYKSTGGIVYSFEPNPTTFKRLTKAKKKNNIVNWEIINKAASNKNETLTFCSENYDHERSRVVESELNPNFISVEGVTIDDLNPKYKVDGIKIDIEGHEEKALLGAGNLIKENKPWIYIECNGSLTNARILKHWEPYKILSNLNYRTELEDTVSISKDSCFDILFEPK